MALILPRMLKLSCQGVAAPRACRGARSSAGRNTADSFTSPPLQGFYSGHSAVLTFGVFVPSLTLGPPFNLGQTFKLLVEVLRHTDKSSCVL